MPNYLVRLSLQRFILPLILTGCIAVRPVATSIILAGFVFALPYVPVVSGKNLKGWTEIYFASLITWSTVVVLCQIITNLCWLTGAHFSMSEESISVTKHFGFVHFDDSKASNFARWALPDFLTCIAAIVVFWLLKKLSRRRKLEEEKLKNVSSLVRKRQSRSVKKITETKLKPPRKLLVLGKLSSVLALCVSGAIQPSLINGVYFFAFLCFSSWLASNKKLSKKFAWTLRILAALMVLHLTAIILYQFPCLQNVVDDHNIWRRLSGISKLFLGDNLIFNSQLNADIWLNPLVLIASYFIITYTANLILQEILITSSKHSETSVHQNSSTSLNDANDRPSTMKINFTENVRLMIEKINPESKQKSLYEFFCSCISNVFSKNVYIIANVLMIVWSILYHSWFGLVLLVWSNAIWMRRNQRSVMMKSSPFLVTYAICMLVLGYVFGMNAYEEMSTKSKIIQSKEIGLVQHSSYPGIHLILKSFFTFSFMFTMRLWKQERIVVEENVAETTKEPVEEKKSGAERSKVEKMSETIKKVCVLSWMWLIILTLLAMAFSNGKMTLIKITNMSLALFFIAMFQISLKAWLSMMKVFWSVLIVYSMSALLAIYSFQFDDFPEFSFQDKVGLTKHHPGQLLQELLPFTSIIVLAGFQMNYFHDKFVELFEDSPEEEFSPLSVKNEGRTRVSRKASQAFEKLLVFIEIHFFEIFFFASFWAFSSKQNFISILIMILLTVGALVKAWKASVSQLILIFSIIFILAVMIFELTNTNPEPPRSCLETIPGFFSKLMGHDSSNSKLKRVLPFMGTILFLTLFHGLTAWQTIKRARKGESIPRVVFEDTNRLNADQSLTSLIKFLINYGFYKFGFEITLFVYIFVILLRIDSIAGFYLLWLPFLVFCARKKAERLWKCTAAFVTFSIFLQCLFLGVAVIFGQCRITHKRINEEVTKVVHNFVENSLLILVSPNAIIAEFLLLSLLSSQIRNFAKEKLRDSSKPFEGGGSNKVFVEESTDPKAAEMFGHSVYIFNDKIKTPIDLLKRYIFKVHFWVSLAIIFLASSVSADVFSLGYIGATMIFLWQGTDFYMKSLRSIIKWWDSLLVFNVCVFVLIVFEKIIGCQFGEQIPVKFCLVADILDLPCANNKPTSTFCNKSGHELPYLSDAVILCVIILQRRIFLSFYFFNVITDAFTTTILSARGAELMENFRIEDANRHLAKEVANLEKLKLKMELIKQSAHCIRQTSQDQIVTHETAIRRGGYFMFEEDVEEKLSEFSTLNIARSAKIETRSESSPEQKIGCCKKVFGCLRTFTEAVGSRMDEASKNFRYALKAISSEKKALTKSRMCTSNVSIDQKVSTISPELQHNIIKQVDTDIKKMHTEKVFESDDDIIGLRKFFKQLLNFFFSQTHLLAYCTVCLVQVGTSSLLSLPMSLVVFLWGALSFPRAPRSFWILLIGYAQIVILIKCFSQFEVVWWDKKDWFIEQLGNHEQKNFAVYELILLMVVFLHRAVLKMFGIWKSAPDYELSDGNFLLVKSDAKTKNLISYALNNKFIEKEESMEEFYATESFEKLLDNEDKGTKADEEVLVRHELKTDNLTGTVEVVEVVKNLKKKPLQASEEVFKDVEGNFIVELSQDDVKLQLREIDSFDAAKLYPATQLIVVETVIEEPSDFYPSVAFMSLIYHLHILSNLLKFFKANPAVAGKRVDVYKYLFLCEFMNFLILLIGFKQFAIHLTPNDTRTVLQHIEENKIPTSLLLLLVIQFAMIIIDRVIYLRKNMTAKIAFHLFTVLYTHVWMFFVLPSYTGHSLNSSYAPIFYYIIKCVSMLLSAYQIRCGFPARVLGNFLMKHYNLVSSVVFRVFMLTPFLFELRSVIDWAFTSTSLTFYEWVKVEAIYAQVYLIKCTRLIAQKGAWRGMKTSKFQKYLWGGGLIIILLATLWFPLVLFAYSTALGKANIPDKVSVSFQIGSYEAEYNMEATKKNIKQLTRMEWNEIVGSYEKRSPALIFLEDFKTEDVVAVSLNTNSASLWTISPPNRKRMIKEITDEALKSYKLTLKVTRKAFGKDGMETTQRFFKYSLKDQSVRDSLVSMLENPTQAEPVRLDNVFPKIVSVQNNGKIYLVPQLQSSLVGGNLKSSVFLQMHVSGSESWWEMKEDCNHSFINKRFLNQNCEDHNTIFIFNEKSFSSQLSRFAVQGVIGLYITLIVFGSRFLRSTMFNLDTSRIIVEEIANVDRILNLCNDIYLVRESKEFSLEEDLVAKLLFLYRSPETLIHWTQHKTE